MSHDFDPGIAELDNNSYTPEDSARMTGQIPVYSYKGPTVTRGTEAFKADLAVTHDVINPRETQPGDIIFREEGGVETYYRYRAI
jgi:hypothetical protein